MAEEAEGTLAADEQAHQPAEALMRGAVGLRRVVVVGTTGSGKTALARRLAGIMGAPHIELDSLHWEPDWREAPTEVLRERVAQVITQPRWVIDGNYGKVSDLVWSAAETLVWLDYSIVRVLSQLLRRTVVRLISGQELWNSNKESFRSAFLTRDSLFLWALKTHWRHRRTFPQYFRQREFAHLHVVRLRSPREAKAFLRSLAAPSSQA